MQVEFEEESRINFNRKKTFAEKIAGAIVATGLVRSQRAAGNILIFLAFILFLSSLYFLWQHLESAKLPVPGVDFQPPADPDF